MSTRILRAVVDALLIACIVAVVATGAYLHGARDVKALAGGVDLPDGTSGAPALRFNSDATMGVYRGLDPVIGTFNSLNLVGGTDDDINIGEPAVDFVSINGFILTINSGNTVFAPGSGTGIQLCNAAQTVCGGAIYQIGTSGKYYQDFTEGNTAPSAIGGDDMFYADSTQHGFLASYNGGAFSLMLRSADLGVHLNAPASFNTGTCTAESQSANSSEFDGDITATCTAQTWIIVFTTTYSSAPHCTVTAMNAAAAAGVATFVYTTSTTAITATVTTATTGGLWAYHCFK